MKWRTATLVLALLCPLSAAAAERTLVFAAASMKDVVEDLARAYSEDSGQEVVLSAASSGTLARQIEAGAPADIFLAANPDWMGYLEDRDLIDSSSRENLIGNRLVAVASLNGGHDKAALESEAILKADRIAMGDPIHVPAGVYAKQALTSLGLWEILGAKAVFGENVRVSLALAARNEVAYAIVYESDARLRDDLIVLYSFPHDTHEPIAYAAALTPDAGEQAKSFYRFLFSPEAQEVFVSYGFTPMESNGSGD
ncbi:MAG: molybdate ABC transporter substrate-binding protein [Pseudomonadota bacterium]